VAKPGNFDSPIKSPTQTSTRFGEEMVVPAGIYETYFYDKGGKLHLIEKRFEIKPGQVVALD
jgi:hypothetical protein